MSTSKSSTEPSLADEFYATGVLSDEEIQKLEMEVEKHPESSRLKMRLAGAYCRRLFDEDIYKEKFKRIAHWFVERHSTEPSIFYLLFLAFDPSWDINGYVEGEPLWLRQIEKHPKNRQVLSNAYLCLSLMPKQRLKLANELLESAQNLEELSLALGFVVTESFDKSQRNIEENAKKILSILVQFPKDEIYAYLESHRYASCAVALGEVYLRAKNFDELKSVTEFLLSREWIATHQNTPAVHQKALSLLGRAKVIQGDIEGAIQILEQSGKLMYPHDYADYLYPEGELARALLDRGVIEPICLYFTRFPRAFRMNGFRELLLTEFTHYVRSGGATIICPSDSDAKSAFTNARLLLKAGLRERGLEWKKRALTYGKRFAVDFFLSGGIEVLLGNTEGAVADILRCLELDPFTVDDVRDWPVLEGIRSYLEVQHALEAASQKLLLPPN